jgi:hypothetical protein
VPNSFYFKNGDNMAIKCGICGGIIPSHMVEVKYGSHYSEHYENEEAILHKDLGRILRISTTIELNQILDEIQTKMEPEIFKNAFHKTFTSSGFIGKEYESLSHWNKSKKDITTLISGLNQTLREAERNKIVIESGEKSNTYAFETTRFGRHYDTHWDRLHIPEIDVCAKCFKWFDKENMALGSLNMLIPNLNLSELNKTIWTDIMNCEVKIELKD